MQKWEFLYRVSEIERDDLRPRSVNGKDLPNWKNGKLLYAYINELGAQGWELVAAPFTAVYTAGTSYRLIFKRPIE